MTALPEGFVKRKYRSVKGQFNLMAICHICDRDTTQTRMTYYVIDCLNDDPFTCDECRPTQREPKS